MESTQQPTPADTGGRWPWSSIAAAILGAAALVLLVLDLAQHVFAEPSFSWLIYTVGVGAIGALIAVLRWRPRWLTPEPRATDISPKLSVAPLILAVLLLTWLLLVFIRIKAFPFPIGDEGAQMGMAARVWPLAGAAGEPVPFNPFWFLARVIGGDDPAQLLLTGRLISCAAGLILLGLIFTGARRRAGDHAALLSTALFAIYPAFAFYGSRFSEDVTFVMLFLAAWLLLSGQRPYHWLAAGLLAGLAATTKGTGLLLLPTLLTLALMRHRLTAFRRPEPYLAVAAFVAALLLVLPGVLAQGGETKDTQIAWLLNYRGVELLAGHDWMTPDGEGGLLQLVLRRASLLTVGELVLGLLLAHNLVPWLLVALPSTLRIRRAEPTLMALLPFALLFLGLISWKGGDAGNALLVLAAPAAVALVPHVTGARLRGLRRPAGALLVAVSILSIALLGVLQLRTQIGLVAGQAGRVPWLVLSYEDYVPSAAEASLLSWIEAHVETADIVAVDPGSSLGLRQLNPEVRVRDRRLRWRNASELQQQLDSLRSETLDGGEVYLLRDHRVPRGLSFTKGFEGSALDELVRVYPPPEEPIGDFEVLRLRRP